MILSSKNTPETKQAGYLFCVIFGSFFFHDDVGFIRIKCHGCCCCSHTKTVLFVDNKVVYKSV